MFRPRCSSDSIRIDCHTSELREGPAQYLESSAVPPMVGKGERGHNETIGSGHEGIPPLRYDGRDSDRIAFTLDALKKSTITREDGDLSESPLVARANISGDDSRFSSCCVG